MAELYGCGVTTVLAADTNVHFGTYGLTELDSGFHKLTYTNLVELCEGIVLEDLGVVVCVKELACVVTGEAVGHLGKVVSTEAEELSLLSDVVSGYTSSGDLDHGTNLVLKVNTSLSDNSVSGSNNYVLNELELLDLAYERNHDLGNESPLGMLLLNVDSSLDNCCGLHLCNLGIGNCKTASTVTHHGVELVERCDDVLDVCNGLALSLCKSCDVSLFSGNELVERGIKESDGNGATLESLVDSLEVSLLHRLDLCKSCFSLLNGVGADHLTECSDSGSLEEHVLGTAKTDTLCAELTSLLCVCGSISVGSNLKYSVLISPSHDSAELACDSSVNGRNDTVVDVTGSTVDGDAVALGEGLACKSELLVLLIHLDLAATGYTASTHTTSNNCCVRGHTATNGEDTLSCLHTGDVLGRGLKTNENDFLALCCPFNCVVSGEYNLTASGSGRSAKTLAHGGSSLKCLCIELGVKKSVKVSGVDHKNCFLLGSHTLVNEVACDLKSSLCGSLTVSGLEHEELTVLNGELHVLHISVMVFKSLANLYELSECLGELLLHLCDGHRSTNTCNNVLALCVGEELTHKLLLAGSGVTGECNTGTTVVAHVTECHHLYVNCGTPRVRDIVVTSVYVCSGVVPRTEYRLDSAHKLLLGVRGEVGAELGLVLCLELISKLLEVVSGKLYVLLNALFFLHLVDEFLKVLLTNLHNNVGVHLNESSVTVPSPSGIAGALCHVLNNVLVDTEVKNGIHHTGHGCTCAGTNGNEKGVLLITELLAGNLLHLYNVLIDFCLNSGVDLLAVLIVLGARFGSDGEALGNGKTYVGHFGKVSALTAEKVTHVFVTFREEINILLAHFVFLQKYNLFFC